jgi:3',5'-cyclic AMP phosphodiesterase CpdA
MHFGAKDNPPIDELLSWIDSLDSTLLTPPVFDDKPSFCLVLGDLVESGTEAQYKEYAEFVQKLDTRGIKTYAVAGNHDLYNSGWTHWERYAAPHTSYYRFVINNVSWYFLDSANGSLGSSQLYNFVDKAHADSNAKLIFTHYPVYAGGVFYFSMSNPRERAVLLDTFARNNAKLVLDGHNHEGSSYNFGSFQEVNLKAFTEKKKWYMLSIDTGNTVSGTLELRDYGL